MRIDDIVLKSGSYRADLCRQVTNDSGIVEVVLLIIIAMVVVGILMRERVRFLAHEN